MTNKLYYLVRLGKRYRQAMKMYARLQKQADGKEHYESEAVRAGLDLLIEKMKTRKQKV